MSVIQIDITFSSVMFYVYIVLINTAIITLALYCLHLVFGFFGNKKKISSNKIAMGSSKSKQIVRAKGLEEPKKENTGQVLITKDNSNKSKKDDEKKDSPLTITILTNKEPIIEKVNPGEDSNIESTNKNKKKSTFLSQIWIYLRKRRKKRFINVPFNEWNGPVQCKISKKSKMKFNSHFVKNKGK